MSNSDTTFTAGNGQIAVANSSASVTINTNSINILNPTDNLLLNATYLSLTSNGLFSVGSNTTNVQINSTSVTIDGVSIYSNSIVPTSLDFGIASTSNLIANSLAIVISNPAGNISINATSVAMSNSGSINIGNSVTNSYVNSSIISVGNSTVNSVINSTTISLLAPLASPTLTGTPTSPTKSALTNSAAIATTNYTDLAVAVETARAVAAEANITSNLNSNVSTLNTAINLKAGNAYVVATYATNSYLTTTYAPLASPALTGLPTVTGNLNISGVCNVGNSTINAVINSSSLIISNSTIATTVNTIGLYIGSNTLVNSSSFYVGNSTVNALVNSSSISITNSISVGNSTVNVIANSSAILIDGVSVTSAGGLTGSTLASGITASSLNSFGSAAALATSAPLPLIATSSYPDSPEAELFSLSADTTAPYYIVGKGRPGPAAIQVGDALGTFAWQAYNSTPALINSCQIAATCLSVSSSAVTASMNFNSATVYKFDNNVTIAGAFCDQSKSVQTPITGFSITVGNNVSTLILTPAGILATGTITMPAAPTDGQMVRLSSSQTVTTLTVSANSGQSISGTPATIGATSPVTFIYHLATTTWYRIQ